MLQTMRTIYNFSGDSQTTISITALFNRRLAFVRLDYCNIVTPAGDLTSWHISA
jgi:hypothetical protein